jgi:cell division protein FtsW
MSARAPAFRWDGALVASALALISIGVVMNYSTTAALDIRAKLPALAIRHVAGVGIALLCALVVSRVPLGFWQRAALPLYWIALALLALTLWIGVEANGARRWLAVPGLPIAFQPAEPARLAVVFAMAAMLAPLSQRALASPALLGRIGALVAAPAALMMLQPNFSSAVILGLLAGVLLFAAGVPLRMLAWPAGAGAGVAALYIALRPYALARVRGFLDPWQSAQDAGFQLVQSFVAFGRGGLLGVGLGNGRQKLFYLPEAHTDFILSVIAEEAGLVGVLVVLGAFAALCWAGLRVARRARDPFPLLLATGATALIVVPALCNAAVVMGLLPTTGLTLPFLSHGSNSLVCMAVAVGILLRASGGPAAERAPSRAPRPERRSARSTRRESRPLRGVARGRSAARPARGRGRA